MKYKKKYIDIINKLRNKKELNFISELLNKQITLKFESFVPKLKNNFKKAILEKGLNYKNQLKEFIENLENNNPKNIEKFIGIHFSENNLIISHLNRTKEKMEIKRTVQVELPGDLVGKDKVDNIEGLTKVIEDIISIQKELYIDITNCPTETIQAEVGEFYEVKFDLQAGTSEVTYIFFYFELNGEYYSRLPLDVDSHSDLFYFPKSGELISSATFVDKLNDGDTYFVSIDVLDKNLNSSFSECEIEFNG